MVARHLLSMALRRGSWTVLLIVALSFRGGISQGGDERHNVTRVRLLSYFPCITARSLNECDVFAYAAAELAVEEVNSLRRGALENVTFELLPVSEADDDPDSVSFDSSELWLDDVAGVIGPFYPDVAARVVPIATNNLNVLSVTYAVTDVSVDASVHEKGFYRSLPSDIFLNKARLKLLLQFDWLKIGVLYSSQRTYEQGANNFRKLFEDWTESQSHDIPIAYMGEFIALELLESDSLEHALYEMADPHIDVRIILGYFGPQDARKVICLAYRYGLVSQNHVWILPFYSTPFWWELSDAELQSLPENERCTNNQMISLLESTIFFRAVKSPPFDVYDIDTNENQQNPTGSVSFHGRLRRKTQELFPELSRNESQPLDRHLYSSQAQRAYEATMLMSRSLILFLQSNNTPQVEWLEITMFRELCRIYNECLLDDTSNNPCNFNKGNESTVAFREWIQDYYGQVVVSQYTGGFQCPVVVSFPNPVRDIEVVLVWLNDSADQCIWKLMFLNESMPVHASCPLDFRWKGNRTARPFSGYSFTNSSVRQGVIFTPVIATLISIYGGIILVISIVWQNNIFIKATSPRLNILLVVPLVVMPWNTLLSFIEYSALYLNISPTAINVMCQLKNWVYFSSLTVFYATLFAKNLRVYRIFHNKRLVSKLRWMSDVALVLQVLLFLLPVLILLIVWTAIDSDTARADTFNQTGASYDYNFIKINYCCSNHPQLWNSCLLTYTLSVAGLATMFGCLNSHIPARYREESAASYKVVAMLVILILIDAIITTYLFMTRRLFATLLWISTLSTCGFAVAALTTLFVPKFVHAYLVHKKVMSRNHTHTKKKLLVLTSEKTRLEKELAEKDKLKRSRQAEKIVLFEGHPASNKEEDDHLKLDHL